VVAVDLVGCASPRRAVHPADLPATSVTHAAPVTSAVPPVTAADAALAWAACKSGQGPPKHQCATLTVPLDYAQPGGQQIGIAVARRPATGTKIGSLITNPGGPGASGIDILPTIASFLTPSVLQHFDLVGFDPRGVARSAPVHCLTGPQLDHFYMTDPAPATDAAFQAVLAADRQFIAGCQEKSGTLLAHISTPDVARDMDRLRQAVGDPKLTYFGFSYGSFLGATYAELFPTSVRALVLDGVIDPAQDAISSTIAQATAFNHQLDAFFANCTADPKCLWKPDGDLRAAFDNLMAQIRAHPLRVGNRTVGPTQALYGVSLPLYDRNSWPDLAAALTTAGQGDGSLLLQLFDAYIKRRPDGSYANEQEANQAINCVDQLWPTDPSAVRQYSAQAASQAPEFGVPVLYSGVVCSLWPVRASRPPHPIAAPGSPPIVVIGSTGDPATPYAAAQALAKELSRGVLLTRVGDGHTGYQFSACIKASVDAYLLDLTVPTNGTTCQTP
jgi:pimeloyl-ACP methyl ester carboxylesterase